MHSHSFTHSLLFAHLLLFCFFSVCPLFVLSKISVAAGIPDFRSKESGLFARIHEEYGMDEPMDIFDIFYFEDDPKPFFQVAKVEKVIVIKKILY